MIKNYLLFSTLVLASHSYAGDISSGGVPDIELVRCNNVLRVWTPVHSETPFIAISITDPELVSEPIHTELTFEFGEGQAYFFAHDSRFQNIDLYLDVKRGASGFYEGYFSFGLKRKKVSCEVLNSRFRFMANETILLKQRFGGSKCFPSQSCIGFSGSILPREFEIPLRYNIKAGMLEGHWAITEDVFSEKVVFDVKISRQDGEDYVYKISIARDSENPTSVYIYTNDKLKTEIVTPFWETSEGGTVRASQKIEAFKK